MKTANELKIKDILNQLNKINIKNIVNNNATDDERTDLKRIDELFHSEVISSIRFSDKIDLSPSGRGFACLNNATNALVKRDFEKAYWEMVSIIEYINDREYISINELSMMAAILRAIVLGLNI